MLQRVRWMGVTLGVVVTLLLVFLLEAVIFPPINHHLYNAFTVEGPGGEVGFTGKAWNSYMALSTTLALAVLPLAFFIGGSRSA